jgi:RNA polymerase sigma factor (sigma-70 family)
MIEKHTDTIDDKSMWDKFLTGDDKVYAFIYKKYVEELLSYGLQFTPNRELVKDCIQDVFVKIYRNRRNLKQTDNIRLYLFMALKNTLFNVFQKDRVSCHIDTVEPVFSVEYSIEDRLIANETEQEKKDKMIQILESLTPRQKEVIHYRYVEGLSLHEICKIMDMNYQSVLNLIQRSLKKVRDTFKKKDRSVLSIKSKSHCL